VSNCASCKHWGSGEPYVYYDPENHDDEINTPHRVCGLVRLVDLRQSPGDVKAFTQDASGYTANLWTAPDFGCALYERST
jgi:hypothetical protein